MEPAHAASTSKRHGYCQVAESVLEQMQLLLHTARAITERQIRFALWWKPQQVMLGVKVSMQWYARRPGDTHKKYSLQD